MLRTIFVLGDTDGDEKFLGDTYDELRYRKGLRRFLRGSPHIKTAFEDTANFY